MWVEQRVNRRPTTRTRNFIRRLLGRRAFRLFDDAIMYDYERKPSHTLAWLICVTALYGVSKGGLVGGWWPYIAAGMILLLIRILLLFSGGSIGGTYALDRRQILRALESNLAARLSLGAVLLLGVQLTVHIAGLNLATGPLGVIIFAFSVGIVTSTTREFGGWRNGDVIFPSRTLLSIRCFTLLVFGISIIQSVMYAFGQSVVRAMEGIVLLVESVVTLYAIILFPPVIRQLYRLKPTHNTHFIMGRPPDPPAVSLGLIYFVLLSLLMASVVLWLPILTSQGTVFYTFYASVRMQVSIISLAILLAGSLSLTLMVRQKNYRLTRK